LFRTAWHMYVGDGWIALACCYRGTKSKGYAMRGHFEGSLVLMDRSNC
jgi:hypothetical protein